MSTAIQIEPCSCAVDTFLLCTSGVGNQGREAANYTANVDSLGEYSSVLRVSLFSFACCCCIIGLRVGGGAVCEFALMFMFMFVFDVEWWV